VASHYDPRFEAPIIHHSAYAEEEHGYDYGEGYGHDDWDDSYPYKFADYGRSEPIESQHLTRRDYGSDYEGEYPEEVDY